MEDTAVLVNIAKVLLLLVNMAFMVGGGLLVYFAQKVKSSGWLEAFKGDYAWVGEKTFLFMLVLGAVVVALAALGCFGAWLRNRLLLTIYAGVLVLTAGLFVAIIIGAHNVQSKAQDWAAKDFPAVTGETSVGDNFNRLYCYAQVPEYCGRKAQDVVQLFGLTNVPVAELSAFEVQQLCDSAAPPAPLQPLCEVCKLKQKYGSYEPVTAWAKTDCPATGPNQLWCGKFLMSGKTGEVYKDNAPYAGCRRAFLSLIDKWSGFLFTMGLIVCISTVIIMGFACLVRHGAGRRPNLDESFIVDSPSPQHHHQQQQQQHNHSRQYW